MTNLKRALKRGIALAVASMMCVGMLQISAFAEGENLDMEIPAITDEELGDLLEIAENPDPVKPDALEDGIGLFGGDVVAEAAADKAEEEQQETNDQLDATKAADTELTEKMEEAGEAQAAADGKIDEIGELKENTQEELDEIINDVNSELENQADAMEQAQTAMDQAVQAANSALTEANAQLAIAGSETASVEEKEAAAAEAAAQAAAAAEAVTAADEVLSNANDARDAAQAAVEKAEQDYAAKVDAANEAIGVAKLEAQRELETAKEALEQAEQKKQEADTAYANAATAKDNAKSYADLAAAAAKVAQDAAAAASGEADNASGALPGFEQVVTDTQRQKDEADGAKLKADQTVETTKGTHDSTQLTLTTESKKLSDLSGELAEKQRLEAEAANTSAAAATANREAIDNKTKADSELEAAQGVVNELAPKTEAQKEVVDGITERQKVVDGNIKNLDTLVKSYEQTQADAEKAKTEKPGAENTLRTAQNTLVEFKGGDYRGTDFTYLPSDFPSYPSHEDFNHWNKLDEDEKASWLVEHADEMHFTGRPKAQEAFSAYVKNVSEAQEKLTGIDNRIAAWTPETEAALNQTKTDLQTERGKQIDLTNEKMREQATLDSLNAQLEKAQNDLGGKEQAAKDAAETAAKTQKAFDDAADKLYEAWNALRAAESDVNQQQVVVNAATKAYNEAKAAYEAAQTAAGTAATNASNLADALAAAKQSLVDAQARAAAAAEAKAKADAAQSAADEASKRAQTAAEAAESAYTTYEKAQADVEAAQQAVADAEARLAQDDTFDKAQLESELEAARAALVEAQANAEQAAQDKAAADAAKEAADEAARQAQEAADEARRAADEAANNPPVVIPGGGDDTPGYVYDGGDDDTGYEDPTVNIDEEDVPLSGLTTRAELVAYLYELEGSPAAELSSFTDVAADSEYAMAIGWAAANGIVAGYPDGTFGPDKLVTVAELRWILTSYAGYKDIPFTLTLEGEAGDVVPDCGAILNELLGGKED